MELSVDEDGQITDYRIVKGISEGVDKEVLRAAKSLNFPFTPARQGNRRVPVKLIVQVNVEASTKRN
ncbi:MAG TPA: energy transducer TonB [Ohtaekwangia sp.]